MASRPSEPRVVLGRVDKAGRLVSADPELEALQREAGSDVGHVLALPQIAAIADLVRKLGIPVARPAVAASHVHDIEMWVNAKPDGDDVLLSLEGWTERPAASPRLATSCVKLSTSESVGGSPVRSRLTRRSHFHGRASFAGDSFSSARRADTNASIGCFTQDRSASGRAARLGG